MRGRILLSLVVLGGSFVGCGDDDVATDAGTSRDAGTRDGSADGAIAEDAGDRDAAPGIDAGPGLACALPTPFDASHAYARTLHVRAGATGGDGSEASPFGDIEEAAAAATPDTLVLVAAGTYDHVRSISPRGEEGRPIAFRADGEVIVDAGAGNTGWSMSDARWVVIEGFTIRNAGVHGMNLDDGGSYDSPSHHVVLRDLTIPSAGSGGNNDCIKMSGVDDFWIEGSDVSGCDRGEIVDMVGCHDGVISDNHFASPVGNGVQAKGGSSDVWITRNVFEDIPGRAVNAGGSTGLEFFRPIDAPHEAARIRVVANLVLRGGTDSGAAVAFVGCDACAFVNNTVVHPSTWIARILQESADARFVPSREGVFANNVVVLRTADLRTFFNVGGGTAPESFVFANNLWFAEDEGAGWAGPSYAGTGIPAGVDELVQRDPLLGDDDELGAESPARGAGRTLPFALPPDLRGRCFETPPSVGALESP
ncbi:MAG: right-handed parallel beta-helix repeat-containing protein [Sandaracinus sp.]|nr:right-handed parallel beta-helix repeat-containing protein [Sandaracinus sp.]MCB9615266.1 right-handed parallel beta-helix repeat-containing protein [Sandaracinus sp.]MCB9620947.1 right-handed parallel beta-helix repeat-containing protein [Sandaracinus sp.]